jgi:hypothetical protein
MVESSSLVNEMEDTEFTTPDHILYKAWKISYAKRYLQIRPIPHTSHSALMFISNNIEIRRDDG